MFFPTRFDQSWPSSGEQSIHPGRYRSLCVAETLPLIHRPRHLGTYIDPVYCILYYIEYCVGFIVMEKGLELHLPHGSNKVHNTCWQMEEERIWKVCAV